MGSKTIACYKCQQTWTFDPPLERRAECPHCRWDARCCLNCRHYDRGAHHECREDQAEWVQDKEHGNFCSWFEPEGRGRTGSEAANAREKLDSLFGGPKPEPEKPGKSIADDLARFLSSKK